MSRAGSNRKGAPPPTRKSLLLRLKDWQDQGAWEEFCRIYGQLIHRTARNSGLREVEAQEVVQETLLAVAKRIASFEYDPEAGSFKGWLLKITRRRISDYWRRHPLELNSPLPEEGHSPWTERLPAANNPALENAWNEEWHQALIAMARALVKRRVSPLQYRMFDLYAIQCQPMKRITTKLGVSAAQVYMSKYRISHLLRKEMKRLEKEL